MPHNQNPSARQMGDREFIVLTALMMSLVALSIDMMLPALPLIGTDLGVVNDNDRQMILTVFMAGMTIAQFFYGPLSDKIGRKPVVLIGTVVYLAGGFICALSQDFTTMLAGRFLQGCGIAAMRILSITIVRDRFAGREMAKIMSMVMSIFILVPCLAPMVGQLTLSVSHWRTIYVLLVLAGILVLGWFWLRQSETLNPEKRRPFNVVSLYWGVRETCSHRVTLGYILASGLLSGAFTSYLFTSQQIFHDIFHSGDKFALYFAILAMVYGVASFTNSRIVVRLGMHRITYTAISTLIVFSIILLGCAWHLGNDMPLLLFMVIMSGVFFCISCMFGNMNAIAMQPLGHMAGTASSVISLMNGALSLVIGASIGQAFNGTLIPFALGMVVCSITTLMAMKWADGGEEQPEQHTGDSPVQLDQAA